MPPTMSPQLRSEMGNWLSEAFLHPIDEHQAALSTEHLAPHLDAIAEELTTVRAIIDEILKDELAEEPAPPDDPSLAGYYEYPIGLCLVIRDRIFDLLPSIFKQPRLFPALHQLYLFTKKGGVLKEVGGIQRRKYFQNAIQAGTYLLDVANDTVDPQKPPVECSTIEDSEFENNDDLELNGQVMESYWYHKVYPNTLFPEISTIFPIITIDVTGKIEIQPLNRSIIAANVLQNLRQAETFLTQSPFAERRLPPEVLQLITNHCPLPNDHENPFEKHRAMIETGEILGQITNFKTFVEHFNNLGITLPPNLLRRLQAEGAVLTAPTTTAKA